MALSFEVHRKGATVHTTGAYIDTVQCLVLDDDYSVDATFEFGIITSTDGPRTVKLMSVTIGHAWTKRDRPRSDNAKTFSISAIRDFPLVRWEQAARGVVTWAVDDLAEWDTSAGKFALKVAPRHESESESPQDRIVDELVESVDPDVKNDHTPAGRRRLASLRKLASVAVDYRNELMHGRSDPAVAIAFKYDVSRSTARSWIHRARNAGLLAPAVGRTAGEGLQLFTQGSYSHKTPVRPANDIDAMRQDIEATTAAAAILEQKIADLSTERKKIEQRIGEAHATLMAAMTARDQARAASDQAKGSDS